LGAVVLLGAIAAGAYFGGIWLWGELDAYIRPGDAPGDVTERKDLVNVFVLIGAGVVGALTALAALLNAYFSRRNLQNAREALRQQRDLDERRAQDDALQAYLEQMGDLLTKHKLKEAKPEDTISLLAQAQTLTVLRRLDERRKRDLLLFVHGVGLIPKDNAVVNLRGADFLGAWLIGVPLIEANLSGANLSESDLSYARLVEVSCIKMGCTPNAGQSR
jgi:uncharacterized protein YjbI with pentapeptide repeats